MPTIRVKIDFEQLLANGEVATISRYEEREITEATLESIDNCEIALMDTAFSAMRQGLSAQMEETSKKKLGLKQKKEK